MGKKWFLISLVGLMVLALFVACTQASPTPVVDEMDEVDVEGLIIERCSGCHSADRVFQADYTEEGWSDEIDDMIQKGAKVNEEEKQLMIEWLVSR